MFSNLCGGGGGGALYCTISGAIIHFMINVHDPDLILLVYMLSYIFFMTGSPRSSFNIFHNLFFLKYNLVSLTCESSGRFYYVSFGPVCARLGSFLRLA